MRSPLQVGKPTDCSEMRGTNVTAPSRQTPKETPRACSGDCNPGPSAFEPTGLPDLSFPLQVPRGEAGCSPLWGKYLQRVT